MAVFISLTTDAFAETFQKSQDAGKRARRAGVDRARRPLRGLEIKDDTYAFLKIVRSDGTEIKLVDSSSPDGESTQYSNFILQSVSEARMEKHQIVDTFGDPYIYFFGESPRFLDVSAVLVDSLDFNWYAEFWDNYNKFFRGTRSVELGARTYMFYDDNVVEGYVLMAQAQKVSEQPLQARLTFRMFLTNYSNVTFVGDPNFPIRSTISLPPSIDLTTADAFTVGQASARAAVAGAVQDAINIQAATGARQQASGFGGGASLIDAIRESAGQGGPPSTGDPFTDGFLLNALEAVGGDGRSKPLRGKIADNWDEYTAYSPILDGGELDDGPPPAEDTDGQVEAEDFPSKATNEARRYGANMNSPDLFARLGIGAHFTASRGFGVSASGGVGASFGVGGGASFGAGFRGGINGGLGFTGGFTASANLNASASISATFAARAGVLASFNSSKQFGASIYGNGVLINGGVTQGTGVGGGIPGGVAGGVGPDGPGTLTQFTGGKGFATASGFASSQGYGNGLSANGAALNVGGAPSAFSTVAAPGQLDTTGSISAGFNIGPNGVSTSENKTGVFA